MHEGLVVDTTSHCVPFNMFSPFYVWPNQVIPVPGLPNTHSHSVEGIWQGLKIIDGHTDISLFGPARAKKRRTPEYGSCMFQFGDTQIDYTAARKEIFVPAYTWMFEHLVPEVMKDTLFMVAESGIQLFFCDVDANPDLENTTSPFSHSSLLVDLVNAELSRRSGMKHGL